MINQKRVTRLQPLGLAATIAAERGAQQAALWAQPRAYADVAYGPAHCPARMALYEQATPVHVTYVRRGHRTLRMSFTYGQHSLPAAVH